MGALSLGLFCDAPHVDRIAQNLARVFGEVLPRVVSVKTSTASAPLRSPGSERLAMSSLQICDGSALITVVDGQAPASPAAAAATSALRQLYGSQKQIPFNFGFSEVKVPCDVVSVRIGVTDGSIECDVDLPLKLSQQSSLPDVSESTLAIMRQYVAAARRVIVDIDEEGASGLEDQFRRGARDRALTFQGRGRPITPVGLRVQVQGESFRFREHEPAALQRRV